MRYNNHGHIKKERMFFMTKTIGAIFADSMEYAPFLDWAKNQKNTEEKVLFGNDCVELYLEDGENALKISHLGRI